jgi:hypothetical protein
MMDKKTRYKDMMNRETISKEMMNRKMHCTELAWVMSAHYQKNRDRSLVGNFVFIRCEHRIIQNEFQ